MKTTLTLLIGLLIGSMAVAQNGINYKAIIKDGSGAIIANQLIQVQFSILEDATIVYTESHVPTTDTNGLIILNIGEGTPITGTFAIIDWANDTHYLNVQVNTGAGLIDMGTTEFATVPYAITSGDAVFEKSGANAFKTTGNIGLGTSDPQEKIHINDTNNAGILLSTDDISDSAAVRFENGSTDGAYTFYKIENRNDFLRIAVDGDVVPGAGYNEIITISPSGSIATEGALSLGNGTVVNEFSTDQSLSGNSDLAVPTERAVKAYVDNAGGGSKTIIIPATAFTGNQETNNIVYRNFGAYAQFDAGSASLVAPFSIPEGATVTSVTFFLRDDTGAGNVNLELSLMRSFRSSTIPSIFFTLSTFATSLEENYNTSFTIASDYNYFLRVRPTSSWQAALGINSVKVTYTE